MRAWLRTLREVTTLALRVDRWRSMSALVLVFILSGVAAATALSGRWLVDSAELGTLAGLLGAVALATAAYGLSTTGFVVAGNLEGDVSLHVAMHLSRTVAATASAIPSVGHLERPDYLDRIMLVRHGSWAMASAGWRLADTTAAMLSLGLSMWLLASVHPALMLLAVLALPLLVTAHRGRVAVQRATEATAELERVESRLHEMCIDPEQAVELRTAGSSQAVSDEADQVWAQALRRRGWAQVRSSGWHLAGWTSYAVGFVAALAMVASLVLDQRATIGDLVLVLTLATQLAGQIGFTVSGITQLGEAGRAIGHYQWLLDYARSQQARGAQPAPDRLVTGLTLRGVDFRYPGTDHDVLGGVDLHLPAGRTVALVGINGAGKSTLVKLVTGMYEPTAGQIEVDGVPLSDLDPAGWRARLTGTFQDFVKLELPAGHAVGVGDLPRLDDRTAVDRAVASAGAGPVVAGLASGLDTQLGRVFDGVQLSHGQWQRLALARGHMRDTPLLVVLDEPTAALDPQAEHDLYQRFVAQAAATTASHGTITLLVSHRFSTVRMADLIVVLADGRVVETGTHAQLLAAGGRYAEHYRTQARGYADLPAQGG